MTKKRLPALTAFTIVIILLGAWLLRPDEPEPGNELEGREIVYKDGTKATISKMRAVKATDLRIAPVASAKSAPFQALYPDESIHPCRAIPMVNNGVYQLGPDRLVVHERTAMVISARPEGEENIHDVGRLLGRIRWADGTCRWTGQKLVTVEGQVEGGGTHQVAGCPEGSPLQTQSDGSFEVRLASGRRCLARVVNKAGESLAMGPAVDVDLKHPTVTLKPTLNPLTDKQVSAAALIFSITREKLRAQSQAEAERLRALNLDTPQTHWLIEEAETQEAAMAEQLARAANPATRQETVKTLLFSVSN